MVQSDRRAEIEAYTSMISSKGKSTSQWYLVKVMQFSPQKLKNKKYKLGGNKILEFNEHIIALEAMIELDFFVVRIVHSSLEMLLC